jgi:predicted ATPase
MRDHVASLEATGLHGRYDVMLTLEPDINILYGRNGSGKTTLLHVLANVLNGAYDRFLFLEFDYVKVSTASGKTVELYKNDADSDESAIRVFLDGAQHETITEASFRQALSRSSEDFEIRRQLEQDKIQRRERDTSRSRTSEGLQLGEAAYFPAFRTMIEAWLSVETEELARRGISRRSESDPVLSLLEYERVLRRPLRDRSERLTLFARRLFGNFVPTLNYPSPLQIEVELSAEVESAIVRVASTSRRILSEAFVDAFKALSSPAVSKLQSPAEILEEIRRLLTQLDETDLVPDVHSSRENVYARLRSLLPTAGTTELSESAANVLSVYRKSLEERLKVQRQVFDPIERYIDAVNEFLEGKAMVVRPLDGGPERSRIAVHFDDDSYIGLRDLSSGERQVVSMLYAATHTSGAGSVVLIDEPEISLHIDWQRLLVQKMEQQLGDRQLIISTHSPEVGADYPDRYQQIQPIVVKSNRSPEPPQQLLLGENSQPERR